MPVNRPAKPQFTEEGIAAASKLYGGDTKQGLNALNRGPGAWS